METKRLNSLDEEQIQQINRLQKRCIQFDRQGRELFLSNEINYHKEMPCFYLAYEDEELLGALVVFAPTLDTAEISAFVHPDHRRCGVFSALLMEAQGVLEQYSIPRILMVTDAKGRACREILTKWQAALSHSEYLMVYHGGEKQVSFPFADRCRVRDAVAEDLPKMTELNMAGFGEDRESAVHIVRDNFKLENTRCFVGQIDDEIFGLANVRKEDAGYYICGFNIAPDYRGKGMGRYLLYQILRLTAEMGTETITLEVDSINHPAFMLYATSGFDVESQVDYYQLRPCSS